MEASGWVCNHRSLNFGTQTGMVLEWSEAVKYRKQMHRQLVEPMLLVVDVQHQRTPGLIIMLRQVVQVLGDLETSLKQHRLIICVSMNSCIPGLVPNQQPCTIPVACARAALQCLCPSRLLILFLICSEDGWIHVFCIHLSIK